MSSISQFPTYSSRSVSPCPQAEPKPRQVWTPEEDRLLAEAVAKETPTNGSINWCKVASHLSRRNNKDCRKRWHYNVAHNIRKGTWTLEEDQRLREAFDIYGPRWSKVAQIVGSRNGDQCWKRWYDCLDPKIDRSPWTPEEDILLFQIVSQQGRNWTEIVNTHFPNRTSLAAKNRYSILRRRQESACAGAASPAPSSRSRSSTPACRGPNNMGNSRSRATTLSATATPSPMLMTSQGSRYLSPTPPTSNQLTPELVAQCFTPSPLSLSDTTDMEATSCSSSGFGGVGLGLILPPSAMSLATTSSSFTTDATTMSTNFDILPFNNSFSQDCGAWNSYAPVMMAVSAGSLTATSMAYNTPAASPSPSMSTSSSFSPPSSLSSSSPPPPSLSLNGIYMPVIAPDHSHNGLELDFNNYHPQTTTQTQQQQQQQFEFIVQTPTPTGTGVPVGYASW
ncbi:hypothetical protein B0T20DRAFT_86507 [Sordaria brevicollis]|uniref:Uncharacterized protein n=1 Tax=Sordaria brevicollis TaxID=83679 RepID=A0AAE0NW43_SORBR|nr:hypothetical protein B0T20DRAFT_86507 [Sordaria brevicollis]